MRTISIIFIHEKKIDREMRIIITYNEKYCMYKNVKKIIVIF